MAIVAEQIHPLQRFLLGKWKTIDYLTLFLFPTNSSNADFAFSYDQPLGESP